MLLLWIAILGPLAGLLINLTLNYALVGPVCNGPRLPQGVLHAVAVSMLLLLVALGVWAWKTLTRAGGGPKDDSSPIDRTRFLATLGAVAASTGVVFVIAQWIPTFMLGACMRAQ